MVKIPQLGDDVLEIDKEQSGAINSNKLELNAVSSKTDQNRVLIQGLTPRVTSLENDLNIVRASNSNGSYIKYPNGDLLCMHVLDLTYSNTSRLQTIWQYPYAFDSDYPRYGSITAVAADLGNTLNNAVTRATFSAGSATLRAFGGTFSSGNTLEVTVTCWGRWK